MMLGAVLEDTQSPSQPLEPLHTSRESPSDFGSWVKITPILQSRKLRLGEREGCVQGHTDNTWLFGFPDQDIHPSPQLPNKLLPYHQRWGGVHGSGVGVEMKEKTWVGDAGIGPSLNSAVQAGGEGGGCNLRDKGSL